MTMQTRAGAIGCLMLLWPMISACQEPPRAPVTGKLDAASCRPARTGETASLPNEWKQFLAYVKVCEVADGKGTTPLSLMTISAVDYYDKLPAGATTVALPKPILFNVAGEKLGTLPYGFPDDPPFSLQVTFADLNDGWPARIELFLQDPTVSGDRALPPLIWNPTARRSRENSPFLSGGTHG